MAAKPIDLVQPRLVPEMIDPWRALGTADAGPAAQALAGAAACLGALA